MWIPILCIAGFCLFANKKDEGASPRSGPRTRSIPPPPRDAQFDTALRFAIGQRMTAEQTLNYVCTKCAPGRRDIATVRQVRDRIERRLRSPQFAKSCKACS
jgi:hypothetical protein